MPTSAPTATPAPTPQPSVTPFAYSWVIAGEGKTNGIDSQFKTSNNDFDNRNGDYDGDLMPGDPGSLPQGGGQGPAGNMVDNSSCDTTMSDNYHVHAFVGLYVNGQEIAVSDAVGIVHAGGDVTDPYTGWPNQEIYGDCFYHVHTHDASGMVHLEDPDPSGTPISGTLFNSGNMFDVWGVQVNGMQFGPFSGPVTVYTSGQFSRARQCTSNGICEVGSNMYTLWTGDPTQVPFYSHEVIWYEVGTGNPDVSHLPGVSFATVQ